MNTQQMDRPASALERELEHILGRPVWTRIESWVPLPRVPQSGPAPHAMHAVSPRSPLAPSPTVQTRSEVHEEPAPPLLAALDDLITRFEQLAPAEGAAESIDRIAALETLIRSASGALAAEEVAFAARQRADQLAAGVKARDLGRGIAEQIAFARKISPTCGARHLAAAQALQTRLPLTWAELRAGRISETQARIAVTRTSHLSDTDANIVDAALAPRMSGWNAGATEKAVDHAAYAIDPRGSVDRKAAAEQDRRVWVRPAPDSMAIVSALLPMAQGVAVFANLRTAAQTMHGTGAAEGRGLGQVMADLLITRCTGQSRASAVPMEIRVTMPLDSLLGNGNQPAWVDDFGPVAAPLVREACGEPGGEAGGGTTAPEDPPLWIRRLFTDPMDGTTVAVDPRRRLFPRSMARHITVRDRSCRQPYCDSPIREVDHVVPYADGGPTTIENGQGVCLRGNKLKELPGWSTSRRKDGSTVVVTPTGHRYIREPQAAAGLPAITRRE